MSNLTPKTKQLLILCVTLVLITALGLLGEKAVAIITTGLAGLFGLTSSTD